MNLFSFDAEYVQRLQTGDPFVEKHFIDYFNELLLLKLRSRLRSRQLIEDILQETLLRVLQTVRKKGGLDHPERLGAFVNSVCNNVLREQIRAEARHPPIPDDAPDPVDLKIDMDAPLIHEQQKRQVQSVLADLPEKDRELLRMIYLDDKDKSEVCRHFNVDSNYLRVLLHRAKARFREVAGRHKVMAQ